jgi:hypothetical protein
MCIPCHHGIALPEIVVGEDGLQAWTRTLNKQLQAVDRGWPSNLGLDVGLTTPHLRKWACYEMSQSASGLGRLFG